MLAATAALVGMTSITALVLAPFTTRRLRDVAAACWLVRLRADKGMEASIWPC
jgi:hypothetical protein